MERRKSIYLCQCDKNDTGKRHTLKTTCTENQHYNNKIESLDGVFEWMLDFSLCSQAPIFIKLITRFLLDILKDNTIINGIYWERFCCKKKKHLCKVLGSTQVESRANPSLPHTLIPLY